MSRTVVIGGVGSTFGESLAREFATAGDEVVLWARSEPFISSLAATLTAETEGETLAVTADVTDPAAVSRAVDRTHDAFGTVDVYIHNARPPNGYDGPLAHDADDLAAYFDVHGYGLAVVVDELLADLRAAGGTVIHNGSERVRWISRAMAEQLAPDGVHVVWSYIDGWIDGEDVDDAVPERKRADPDELAAEYRHLVEQDRSVGRSAPTSDPGGTTASGRPERERSPPPGTDGNAYLPDRRTVAHERSRVAVGTAVADTRRGGPAVRTITRNAIVVILAVVALLLALGALPSYLKSGDPYYVTATTADAPAGAVNVSNLSERRFEYSTTAVTTAAAGDGTGRSDPYWRGPFGLKEGFSHSPFDEFDALTRDYPNATGRVDDDTRVYAALNGTTYRLDIAQTPGAGGGTGDADGSAALAAPGEVAPAEAEPVAVAG